MDAELITKKAVLKQVITWNEEYKELENDIDKLRKQMEQLNERIENSTMRKSCLDRRIYWATSAFDISTADDGSFYIK